MSETEMLTSMTSQELTYRMALWKLKNEEHKEAMEKARR